MQSVALQPLTSPEALQPPKITPVPLPYSPPFLRPPRGAQAPWRGLVEELVRKFFIFDSSAASKIFENSFAPTKNRKLENPAAVTARFLRLTLIDRNVCSTPGAKPDEGETGGGLRLRL